MKTSKTNDRGSSANKMILVHPRIAKSFISAPQISHPHPSTLLIISQSLPSRLGRLLHKTLADHPSALAYQISVLVGPPPSANLKPSKSSKKDELPAFKWCQSAVEVSAGALSVFDTRAVRSDSLIPLLDASSLVINTFMHLLHATGVLDITEPICRSLPDFIPVSRSAAHSLEGGVTAKKRISPALIMAKMSNLTDALPNRITFTTKHYHIQSMWKAICDFVPPPPPTAAVALFTPPGAEYPRVTSSLSHEDVSAMSHDDTHLSKLAPEAIIADELTIKNSSVSESSHAEAVTLVMVAAKALSLVLPDDILGELTFEKDPVEIFRLGLHHLLLVPTGTESEIRWMFTSQQLEAMQGDLSANGIVEMSNTQLSPSQFNRMINDHHSSSSSSLPSSSNKFVSNFLINQDESNTLSSPRSMSLYPRFINEAVMQNTIAEAQNSSSSSAFVALMEASFAATPPSTPHPSLLLNDKPIFVSKSNSTSSVLEREDEKVKDQIDERSRETSAQSDPLKDVTFINDERCRLSVPPSLCCFSSARALSTIISAVYWLQKPDSAQKDASNKEASKEADINKKKDENSTVSSSVSKSSVASLTNAERALESPLLLSGALMESILRPTLIVPSPNTSKATNLNDQPPQRAKIFASGFEILSRSLLSHPNSSYLTDIQSGNSNSVITSNANVSNSKNVIGNVTHQSQHSEDFPKIITRKVDEWAQQISNGIGNAMNAMLPIKNKVVVEQRKKDKTASGLNPMTPISDVNQSPLILSSASQTPAETSSHYDITPLPNSNNGNGNSTAIPISRNESPDRLLVGFQSSHGGAIVLLWPLMNVTVVVLTNHLKGFSNNVKESILKSICLSLDVELPDTLSFNGESL
eukprot:GDKJ01031668.1.p1 GENE.GDKJ01031668.1~~GDKJ01031668.1.p1  ORF type:complete len:922 (+),score=238.09 GDKJ01031668.1:157-2766(+)